MDLAMLVWIAAGVLSFLGALTYGELGAMAPHTGGLDVYVREAFGPLPAFLHGWTLFAVMATGSVATLAGAFASYLNQLLPLHPVTQKMVALAMVVIVAAINVLGARRR